MMTEEVKRMESVLLKMSGQPIENVTADQESKEYGGHTFQLGPTYITFRKAKITPKKIGQFVTLWKRNAEKQTEPFHVNDNFDFYIVVTEQESNFGFFFFPKQVLSEKHILTTDQKVGKRGFRVYPDWTTPENKQAKKTKSWQTSYFIDLTHTEIEALEKLTSLVDPSQTE